MTHFPSSKDREFTKTAEIAWANGKSTFSAWVDFHDWKLRSASHDVVWALGRYISSRTAAQAVKEAQLKSTATSQGAKRVCLPAVAAIPPDVPSVPPSVSEDPTLTVTTVKDSTIKAPSTPADERQMWDQAMKASLKEQAEKIEEMTAKNAELTRALEASKAPRLIKLVKITLPANRDAGASGSGEHRTEATYEELDALRGV
jgi:hypothetical protein